MVATVTFYLNLRNRALPGEGFDGVVRLSVAERSSSTGVLLYDGKAILTAAHLVHGGAAGRDGTAGAAPVPASQISITFETPQGIQRFTAGAVSVHPDYDPVNANHDLALVWLANAAPLAANRYSPYRESDELGQDFTFVGYGIPGSGSAGALESDAGPPLRLKARNTFDDDGQALKDALGSQLAWKPLPGTQLLADFDNGLPAQDAFGRLIGIPHRGLGIEEGLITTGDSGGPAFLGEQVAGIATFRASLANGSIRPDVDGVSNSSFGEIASWQRVSANQQWLDQSLRARYPDAPKTAAEVREAVPEGNSGTSLAYFLVEFTGVRTHPDQWLSVDYRTRDGTARAGEDYLPAQGRLVLYPGENQAVIAVEIVGDSRPEPDETFYLDIFNPDGGSFGPDRTVLTAMRTIVDDDGWF